VADSAIFQGKPLGLVDGNAALITGQFAAAAITWALAAVVTWILLKLLDATMGLRVTQEQEVHGLDLSQHNEEGYIQL
jgi:Amt family ammonium transporter